MIDYVFAYSKNERGKSLHCLFYVKKSNKQIDQSNIIQLLDDAAREKEIEKIFNLLDTNNDGKISKKECLKIVFHKSENGHDSDIYKRLSVNKDLAYLLKPGEWRKVFEDIDDDSDGLIDIDELVTYVNASSEHTVKESEKRSAIETVGGEALAVVRVLKKAKRRTLNVGNNSKKVMM